MNKRTRVLLIRFDAKDKLRFFCQILFFDLQQQKNELE